MPAPRPVRRTARRGRRAARQTLAVAWRTPSRASSVRGSTLRSTVRWSWSAVSTTAPRRDAKGRRALDPDAPTSFVQLLSSRLEAEYVAELHDEYAGGEAKKLLKDRATVDALVAAARGARYLHVATHGWFAAESAAVSMLDRVGRTDAFDLSLDRARDAIVGFLPETLCGLALAGADKARRDPHRGGIGDARPHLLRARRAVGLQANVGIRRAGQGDQSLQTALLAAGARTAITSLWKVDDAATRRLFEIFYTKLWKDGLPARPTRCGRRRWRSVTKAIPCATGRDGC
ncbi:MAG: CHAT domain-containing protein [Planctomycetota bacterium]